MQEVLGRIFGVLFLAVLFALGLTEWNARKEMRILAWHLGHFPSGFGIADRLEFTEEKNGIGGPGDDSGGIIIYAWDPALVAQDGPIDTALLNSIFTPAWFPKNGWEQTPLKVNPDHWTNCDLVTCNSIKRFSGSTIGFVNAESLQNLDVLEQALQSDGAFYLTKYGKMWVIDPVSNLALFAFFG